MSGEGDIDKRLEEEIGNLSTRLVTAVNRQVELEETVLSLRKSIHELETKNAVLTKSDESYQLILPKYLKLQEDFKEANIKKEVAENENGRLKTEVDDLSATLFDEANTMVSNASRETHNFKIKNKKLYEEIDEKNIIISNLQDQLQDLKQMFIKIEDKQRLMVSSSHNNTPNLDQKEFGEDNQSVSEDDYQVQQLSSSLYAPYMTALRFDLNNYNKDFKGFVYTLIKPEFTLDLTHLKNLAYFKPIWMEEIESTVTHVPNLPSTTLLNRWQKSKVFWSSLIDGRVSIEPIKGYSEGSKSSPGREVAPELLSVAITDPCAFCGESRSVLLEHCRLHHYKIYEADEVMIAIYPLCHYCVLKLRNLCDFFAKIRLIKSNVFKLKQVHLFDDYVHGVSSGGGGGSGSNFYRRTSSNSSSTARSMTVSSPGASEADLTNGHVYNIKLDAEEEAKLIKIYFILAQIRLKIFYSKLGLRENANNQFNDLNIDEVHYETFSYLIPHRGETKQTNKDIDATISPKRSIESNAARTSIDSNAARKSIDSNAARKSLDLREAIETTIAIETENNTLAKDSRADSSDTSAKNDAATPPLSRAKVEKSPLDTPDDDSDTREFEDAKTTLKSETKQEQKEEQKEEPKEKSKSKSKSKLKSRQGSNSKPNSATSSPEKAKSQSDLTEAQLFLQKMKNKPHSPDDEGNGGLKRSKSKSKQFKAKIDKDLDQTLEMLAEMEADGSK
ncbi:SEC2 [Candida margitis]|uniref:SEC2 n=1 Tax=Candida margitis TaxID=1775924 RepID=UPI00222701B7|nr:SEC2 [Candida margitis]KAI5969335.1 SEC2 [Candida margitis]